MRNLVHASQIYPALKALLGLPDHLVSFNLSVRAGHAAMVTCEYCVALDAPGITQLGIVLSEFELVKRQPATKAEPEPIQNFDAWMRDRTDRAHAEYMAGHAAGGIAY